MNDDLNVLIVDDNRTNLMLMDMLVRKLPGCATAIYWQPVEVVSNLPSINFDIAIVDYQMPEMNGVELIERIRLDKRHADKPVVMVTADHNSEVRMAALEAGAVEFLHKPIEPVEFRTRIKNLIRLCEVQRKLSDHSQWLRSEVEKETSQLRWREEEIINRLARVAEFKDSGAVQHTARIARYSAILAHQLGLNENMCRIIQLAAPMHDIGKAGIPDDVLLKRGLLDERERRVMSEHTSIGAAMLEGSPCELLCLAADIARSHHERWDGTGYPAGLKGTEIPLVGRIAAVADVFDSLTSQKPFKKVWAAENAFRYLQEEAGRQFDPDCVSAFVRARDEVEMAMSVLADPVSPVAA